MTEAQIREADEQFAPIGGLAGLEAMVESAVQGALAEIGHRPFTEAEVVESAKDALDLDDES